MRVPRDLSGAELTRRLEHLGYQTTRQTGSHVRLTAYTPHGTHHLTVPNHDPIRIGTLSAILAAVCTHHGLTRDELLHRLLG